MLHVRVRLDVGSMLRERGCGESQRTNVASSRRSRINSDDDTSLEPESERGSSVVDLDSARWVGGVIRVQLEERGGLSSESRRVQVSLGPGHEKWGSDDVHHAGWAGRTRAWASFRFRVREGARNRTLAWRMLEQQQTKTKWAHD